MPVYQHDSGEADDSPVNGDPSGENFPPVPNPPDIDPESDGQKEWLQYESISVGSGPQVGSRLTGW